MCIPWADCKFNADEEIYNYTVTHVSEDITEYECAFCDSNFYENVTNSTVGTVEYRTCNATCTYSAANVHYWFTVAGEKENLVGSARHNRLKDKYKDLSICVTDCMTLTPETVNNVEKYYIYHWANY